MKKLSFAILLICIISTSAFSFERKGFYSVSSEGWTHTKSNTPKSDLFTCSKCVGVITIRITYGQNILHQDATNDTFIKAHKTQKAQKEFAESLMKNEIPLRFNPKIGRTGLSKLGRLDVLEFTVTAELNGKIANLNSMVAVHKTRFVNVALNYFDGAMNPEIREHVEIFYSSLKFY